MGVKVVLLTTSDFRSPTRARRTGRRHRGGSAGLEHLAARVLACHLVVGGGHDVRQAIGWNDDDTVVIPEDDVTRVTTTPPTSTGQP